MSMIDDAMSALQDGAAGAARGAAAGSIVPGIGTAIGAGVGGLLGVALNLAPGLLPYATAGSAVAQNVASAVQSVTGTDDAGAAQAALFGNAQMTGELHVRLAEIAADARAAELQAQGKDLAARLADLQGARQTTVDLARAGSPIAWGAPVVSVLAVLAFGGAVAITLLHAVPDGSKEAANVLLGGLALGFGQVLNYWLGSSAGSASKDGRIANMIPASLLPRPAAIVPAAEANER